jgi:hypothetical protein
MRTLRSAAVTLLSLCLLLSLPLTALAGGPPDGHPGEPGVAAATAAADRDLPAELEASLPDGHSAATTAATVIPSSAIAVSPGADAPNRSIPTVTGPSPR